MYESHQRCDELGLGFLHQECLDTLLVADHAVQHQQDKEIQAVVPRGFLFTLPALEPSIGNTAQQHDSKRKEEG